MDSNCNGGIVWTGKRLSVILLTIIYSLTPSTGFAQTEKTDAKISLPVVSYEMFQAIAQFYEYDPNMPLEAHIVSKQDYAGADMEKIVFTGFNYSKVPTFLILPKDGKEKHPVVLIVDGYSGTKERWLQDGSWPNRYF